MESNTTTNYSNSTGPLSFGNRKLFMFRILFYPILILFGIILNCMVIVVLRAGKLKLSYVYRYLLINLAIADIGMLLVTAPVSVIIGPAIQWKIGETLCRLLVPFGDTLIPVSSGTLFLLAIARYRAIKDPFLLPWTKTILSCLIVCNWFFSILLAVTPLQIWIKTMHFKDGSLDRCYLSASRSHVVAWYSTVIVVLIIPTLGALWLMALTSKQSLEKDGSIGKTFETNQTLIIREKENKHASHLIMTSSIVYTVLVVPYFAFTLALRSGLQQTRTVKILVEISQLLLFLQCAMDPVIYCLVNKNIRRQMFVLSRICKIFCKRRRSRHYRIRYIPKSKISMSDVVERLEFSSEK